ERYACNPVPLPACAAPHQLSFVSDFLGHLERRARTRQLGTRETLGGGDRSVAIIGRGNANPHDRAFGQFGADRYRKAGDRHLKHDFSAAYNASGVLPWHLVRWTYGCCFGLGHWLSDPVCREAKIFLAATWNRGTPLFLSDDGPGDRGSSNVSRSNGRTGNSCHATGAPCRHGVANRHRHTRISGIHVDVLAKKLRGGYGST